MPAEVSYCPFKLGFCRNGRFGCFSLDSFHNDSLFTYCPAFDLTLLSVFHHIQIMDDIPGRCSAFDLGSLYLFKFMIAKVLNLILPYKVIFIGSRD